MAKPVVPHLTWTDIVAKAQSGIDATRQDGSVTWFRGERDANWELKSTLHRHIEDYLRHSPKQLSDARRAEFLREEYKTLSYRFRTEAWPLLGDQDRSDWGIVFSMQHFGLPTRLLDWTESFACAVFFAQFQRKRDDAAAIWMLDPSKLNNLSCKKEEILSLGNDSARQLLLDTSPWLPGT